MLTPTLALALATLLPAHDVPKDLHLKVEVTPKEIQLGDVIFVRVSVVNLGKDVVMAPAPGTFELSLAFRLWDEREDIEYNFPMSGMLMGGGAMKKPLEPGEQRLVAHGVLPMPQLDKTAGRFWDPQRWPPGEYHLFASCQGIRGSESIIIKRRPEKEMEALLKQYGAGPKERFPRDWDVFRPTLGRFGLLTFPIRCSKPENLAALEKLLSPGSLRNVAHVTRLTQAVYDTGDIDQKRQATKELLKWIDSRPEIEREYLAQEIYSWASNWDNRKFTSYLFEFADQIIPRMPPSRQEECRKQIKYRRDALRKYLEKQKAEAAADGEPKKTEDGKTPPPRQLE